MPNKAIVGQKAEKFLAKTDVLLSLILICNNFVNIVASAISTMIGMPLSGEAGVPSSHQKMLVPILDMEKMTVGEFTTSAAPTLDEEVKLQSDGSVLIEGSANIRDLNTLFNWNVLSDEVRTFNGLIVEHLENIPDEATQVTALEVGDNMVKLARVPNKHQYI